MEHKILFLPAWDKTDPDPNKDYGVSDLTLKFLVIGNKGTVEFELHTNWYLDYVMDRRLQSIKRDVYAGKEDFLLKYFIHPFPADICYDSLERMSEDDIYFENGLDGILDHKPCYYGYRYEEEENGLWTTDYVYKKLIEEGDKAVWDYLETYYSEVFGKE